jgi:hypothetical protein
MQTKVRPRFMVAGFALWVAFLSLEFLNREGGIVSHDGPKARSESLPLTSLAMRGGLLPVEMKTDGEVSPMAFSTWSAAGPTDVVTWRSDRMSAELQQVLRFRVAGDLGDPTASLSLVVKSASGEQAVIPDGAPGLRWKTVNVFRPDGEWWVEVKDEDPVAWFAFTEPVEMNGFTYGLGKGVKHRSWVLWGAIGMFIVGTRGLIWEGGRRAGSWIGRGVQWGWSGLIRGGRGIFRFGVSISRIHWRKIAKAWRWGLPTGALVLVGLVRAGFWDPVRLATVTAPVPGPDWLASSPRNYFWYAVSAVALGALLFMPGLALRRFAPRWWPRDLSFVAVPGLLGLAVLGGVFWQVPSAGALGASLWLVANIGFGAWRAWQVARAPVDSVPSEWRPMAVYAAVCVSAVAWGVLPEPVTQEFDAKSTVQARMIASPPDHAIPFRTAEYFHSGRDGIEDSDAYFGSDWSVASRGPLMPLAINGVFHVFDARPQSIATSSLQAWPASPDGYYLARILLILANGLVILAGMSLAGLLIPARGAAQGRALLWFAAAPLVMINLDFIWPKLLASALVMLALQEVISRRSLVRAGVLAGLSYLSHPVGALVTPALVVFMMWSGAASTGDGKAKLRSMTVAAVRFFGGWLVVSCVWLGFKSSLGHPDVFLHYPMGDGRGFMAAESWRSWVECRWNNLWYSLVPGAFYVSEHMKHWVFGPLSEPARWGIYYAKTLPAGMGHAVFLVLIWAGIRPAKGMFMGYRRWLLGFSFGIMLVFWGYSWDGLGRNCLEPLGCLALVYAAAASSLSRNVALGVAVTAWVEAWSVRAIGIFTSSDPVSLAPESIGVALVAIGASLAAIMVAGASGTWTVLARDSASKDTAGRSELSD